MRTFKIPFSYMVYGEVEIEATNLDSAIQMFETMALNKTVTGHVPVLDKATKLTPDLDTLEVNKDEAADINPPTKYRVYITRTQTVEVEVEAGDEDEAEEIATQMVSEGEVEDDFQEGDIEVTDVEENEK
jgi:hypothetical protein